MISPLRATWTSVALGGVLLLGLLGGVFAVVNYREDERVEIDLLGRLASAAASDLERYVRAQQDLLTAIGRDEAFARRDIAGIERYFARLDDTSLGFDGGLFFIDRDGVRRANSVGAPELDVSDVEWVQRMLVMQQPLVSEARVARSTGAPVVVIAAPVRDESGAFIGMVSGAIRLDRWPDPTSDLRRAGGVEVVVLDRAGVVLADPTASSVLVESDPTFDHAALRRSGSGVLHDVPGHDGTPERVIGYATVPAADWLVLVERPYATIVAPARATLTGSLIAIVLADLLVLFALLAIARRERRDRAALLGLVDELAAREDAREAFVGMVSHELRTPITSIYGMATLLRARPGHARRDELLADIEAESESLRRMTEDLLVISRAERGILRPDLEPVLVGRTADAALRALGQHYPAARVERRIAPDLVPVLADAASLVQVLLNLLENAAKYAPGSPIELSARLVAGRVEIVVADRGPGIATDERERIFELLYRSPATARLASGTGVGLFVVRSLVRAMAGEVTVEERPGGGSLFRLSLAACELGADDEAASATA